MSHVGSLLVRDRVLSLPQMEAALHRQRIDGGELESVLLDMALVPENVLNAYRAAVYDLFPATREELRVDHTLGAPLTKMQWAVLRAMPFTEEDGRLTIAVAEPMDPAIITRLERDTSKKIVQRIVTSVRLNIALNQWARSDLSERDERLARKLAAQTAGVAPFVQAPASRLSSDAVIKTGRRQRIETLTNTPTPSRDPMKTLLRSAARDFEYVALFAVDGDLACGVDALGDGADAQAIAGIAIPLDIPSALSEAIASRAVTELGNESLDILIRKDLGRSETSAAVIIPLMQAEGTQTERQFLLYADRAEQASAAEISALDQARTEFEESHVRELPAGVTNAELFAQDFSVTRRNTPLQLRSNVLHIPHTAPPPPSLHEVRGAARNKRFSADKVSKQEDWLALITQSEGELDSSTKDALQASAPECIDTLGKVFPGRLWPNRDPANPRDPAAELSAVCRALVFLATSHGARVAALLEEQFDDKDKSKRLCAIRLCETLCIEAVRTRVSLWSKVAKELESKNKDIRRAAIVALRHRILHAPLELPALSTRHAALRVSNSNEDGLAAALSFVEEVRDPGALPALFTLLSDPTYHAQARQIATVITALDLGRDSGRWRMWHQQNVGIPRFFWLVKALGNPDMAMRAFAAEELETYVGDNFGYSPTASKDVRTKAQQAFVAWHADPMQLQRAGATIRP